MFITLKGPCLSHFDIFECDFSFSIKKNNVLSFVSHIGIHFHSFFLLYVCSARPTYYMQEFPFNIFHVSGFGRNIYSQHLKIFKSSKAEKWIPWRVFLNWMSNICISAWCIWHLKFDIYKHYITSGCTRVRHENNWLILDHWTNLWGKDPTLQPTSDKLVCSDF